VLVEPLVEVAPLDDTQVLARVDRVQVAQARVLPALRVVLPVVGRPVLRALDVAVLLDLTALHDRCRDRAVAGGALEVGEAGVAPARPRGAAMRGGACVGGSLMASLVQRGSAPPSCPRPPRAAMAGAASLSGRRVLGSPPWKTPPSPT